MALGLDELENRFQGDCIGPDGNDWITYIHIYIYMHTYIRYFGIGNEYFRRASTACRARDWSGDGQRL